MGRLRRLIDTDFVTLAPDKKSAKCLLCDKKITNHTGNIKRHYRKLHHYNFDDYHYSPTPKYKKQKIKHEVSETKTTADNGIQGRKLMTTTMTSSSMSRASFQNTDDEGSSATQTLQPWSTVYLPKITETHSLQANPLNTTSTKEIQHLADSVEKKIISLKLDIAARAGGNFLAISIQYLEEFELRTHTLAIVQLQASATADHIMLEVMKSLEKYKIKVSQLYSVTTDNGTNVVETNPESSQLDDDEDDDEDQQYDASDHFDRIDRALRAILPATHCAAHSLHLAVWDVLRPLAGEFTQQRRVVRMIRAKMRHEQLTPLPTLDEPKRWMTTYMMVKSIRSIRIMLQSQVSLPFDIDWKFLDDFHESFTPVADFATKLRKEEFIVGDFLIEWLRCEIKLRELADENRFAKMLLDAMARRRQQSLMENEAFLAGIYLDPRLCCKGSILMDDGQKRRTVKHLMKLWQRMKTIRGHRGLDDDGSGAGTSSSRNGLKGMIMGDKQLKDLHDMEQALVTKQYCNQLPLDSNILQYWMGMKHQNVLLGQMAEIALSMPTTQVSVERAFANLPAVVMEMEMNESRSSDGNREDEEEDEEEEDALLVEMHEGKSNEIKFD